MILQHRLKANPERPTIEVVKKYGELPPVKCYSGQLNQAFMNLFANAIDALDESNQGKTYALIEKSPNVITIRTSADEDKVTIRIADNGPGMPEEVRSKLFNAFFTTKPEGKGTGLGLSISYQIVTETHGGNLYCLSSPGNGAEFVIELPLEDEEDSEQ
jgi:signal transduction histidine kinase